MITEDKIAAATIAQIFGSELLHLQSKATTDAGSIPQMVKMDPKQFLFDSQTNNQVTQQRRAEEQRMIQALQREAEAAYPMSVQQDLPPATAPLQEQPAFQQPTTTVAPIQQQRIPLSTDVSSDVMERIACSLEKIAASLIQTKLRPTKVRKTYKSK